MSITIKVSSKGSAYFPDELRQEGYVGSLTVVPDACAALIEKPDAKPKDILKSLEVLAAHYRHLSRIEQQSRKLAKGLAENK